MNLKEVYYAISDKGKCNSNSLLSITSLLMMDMQ